VHEIKHDGYRMIARRTDDRVRLYTRRGFNWADRYPRIVEALRSLPVRSIVIDGEAVVCGKDGKSDFDKLHSSAYDASVFLYGFDLIEPQARKAAIGQRGDSILRASRRRRRDHLRALLGLEGIVSKRGATCPTVPADGGRGSRSRTRRARPSCGSKRRRGSCQSPE
jgi:ATP-dependent DNA ligase